MYSLHVQWPYFSLGLDLTDFFLYYAHYELSLEREKRGLPSSPVLDGPRLQPNNLGRRMHVGKVPGPWTRVLAFTYRKWHFGLGD
jgi:hypothetical protein